MKISLTTIVMLCALTLSAQNELALLPAPVKIEMRAGEFIFSRYTQISAPKEFADIVPYMKNYLPGDTHSLGLLNAPGNNIKFVRNGDLEPEEYQMEVTPGIITIEAGGYGGAFNAVVTMLQMADPQVYRRATSKVAIRCAVVSDAPLCAYRGFMLDVARTFQSKEQVMRLIDNLSQHKINKLHWHLSDDEGWRIEIKSYPKLTSVGGYRGGDSPIRAIYGKWDTKYGGFYTQQEIRDIVAYARVRNIEVIPEIDLPGHSRAAAHAYPEILCNFEHDTSTAAGYDRRNVWCVAREENYNMLRSIMSELASLFPSPYIHIGGDEVGMSQWEQCPDCRRVMQQKHYTKRAQLFDLFVDRMATIVEDLGKRPAVWNEAAESGRMSRSTHVYSWENMTQAAEVAKKGYKTIVTAGSYFYFDMKQSPEVAGATWAGMVDLYRVYSFDPSHWGFDHNRTSNIIGIQATYFSEILLSTQSPEFNFFDYQLFPRICALAEVAWNGERRASWDAFNNTLNTRHYSRMGAMGISPRHPTPDKCLSKTTIQPLSTTTLDLPISAFTTQSALWYTRLRSNSLSLKIMRTEIISPDTTECIISYPQSLNPLNLLRVRTNPRNVQGSVRYTIKNESNLPVEVGVEVERSPYIEPAVTLTSSMGEKSRLPFRSATDYNFNSVCYTATTCIKGADVTFTFNEPLTARTIEVATGLSYIARYQITSGYVECSSDGINFTQVAQLTAGGATITPPAPIKALRLISTCNGNGENFVAIQDLKITPHD